MIAALKDVLLPLSVTDIVTVFPLREPVEAEVAGVGLEPNSKFWLRAAISARRQFHSALDVIRVPFMNVNGSGKKGLVGKDEGEGIGGMLHVPPPPLPACMTVTVCVGAPVAVTVTAAVSGDGLVFCCAVTVTAPLFEPDVGFTVSHG